MLALIFIAVALVLGYALLQRVFPVFLNIATTRTLADEPMPLPNWLVALPASYLLGSLLMTWLTYGVCYALKSTAHPMQYGVHATLLILTVLAGFIGWQQRASLVIFLQAARQRMGQKLVMTLERVYVLLAFLLASFIAFYTFYVWDGIANMGVTVWSDFGPHLSVIRSFSQGDNFPTGYPHFAAEGIRYHFLFQFMVATLETLGLRLDFAFNIPSILSLVALFMLLYALAVAITGQRWIGVLTGVLFFFRSSFAFFTHIKELIPSGSVLKGIWETSLHIGKTEHENWGLWAQNVYANQRHFAFSISILILILLALLPLLRKMAAGMHADCTITSEDGVELPRPCCCQRWHQFWHELAGRPNAWLPESWRRAVFLGALLGAISFWNGAVVIAGLLILFVLALFSKHRLEFLIIAVIAVAMAQLESAFFIGGKGVVDPQWMFGFLAENKTLPGVLAYYIELLGLFPFLLLIVFCGARRSGKTLMLAFFAPLLLATTLVLTTDINANHKFVMIAVIFLNIFIAGFLYCLFVAPGREMKVLAGLLLFLLTATGLVDLLTLYNMNKRTVTVDLNSPIAAWVVKNTSTKDVFLTDMYVVHPVLMSGRKVFFGWPYYAWSAGYDTNARGEIMKRLYGATDSQELRFLARSQGIAYIMIDDQNRTSREYVLNEDLIRRTFPVAYDNPELKTTIFRVK